MNFRTWVKDNPTAFALTLTAAVLITQAVNLVLPTANDGGRPLLGLLLLACSMFVVVAVVFVIQARRQLTARVAGIDELLQQHLQQASAGFDDCLQQARSDFRRELAQASQGLGGSIESAQQVLTRHLETDFTRLDEGINSVRKDCRIIFEPDFEVWESSLCYEQLVQLIRGARRSIFVIPNPYTAGKLDTWELPPRQDYLKAVEERVLAMRGSGGFEYLRVQQVPDLQGNLLSHIGRSAAEHMLRLHQTLEAGARERVRFRLIEQAHISGQLIIDGDTLIKFISGVDHHGNKRLVAITVMRDPTSNAINEYYERLRTNLLDGAVKLNLGRLRQQLADNA